MGGRRRLDAALPPEMRYCSGQKPGKERWSKNCRTKNSEPVVADQSTREANQAPKTRNSTIITDAWTRIWINLHLFFFCTASVDFPLLKPVRGTILGPKPPKFGGCQLSRAVRM